jgi:hypothetical protein
MVILPDLAGKAVLVAVTITALAEGTDAGAVYVAVYAPVITMVP